MWRHAPQTMQIHADVSRSLLDGRMTSAIMETEDESMPSTTVVVDENPIYFCDCVRHLPGNPTYRTVSAWATEGRRGSDGINHTIEWCRLPKGPVTSRAAYKRFIKRLNGELEPLAEDVDRNNKKAKKRRSAT